MFRVSENRSYGSKGFENETYNSSNSKKFNDSYDENYGAPYSGRNREVHEHQPWMKSSKFNANRDSDEDDDGYKSSGSKGYRSNENKKLSGKDKFGGFGGFGGFGSSKSKVLAPYQSVMLKVRTQCDECVRKVKRAVAHMDGVESVNVDMNQKKITIKGNIDPQRVLKKATKTGKSVELITSKGIGTNVPTYNHQYGSEDRFNASSDNYQNSSSEKYKQSSKPNDYQHSNGDNYANSKNGQSFKGVKFNLTPEYDRRDNGDEYQQGAAARPKKKTDYDRYGSPDTYRSSSEKRISSKGDQQFRQDSDSYQGAYVDRSNQRKDYDRQSSIEKPSTQRKDYDRQLSGEKIRQNLVYPASRDDGSYMFSDENANNCSIM